MDLCQEKVIHADRVERALDTFPEPTAIQELVDLFKALGEPSRMKIVLALVACEMCVCDLSVVCGLTESAVSHQLRMLRNLKIVSFRREGKIVFYRLENDDVRWLVNQGLGAVSCGRKSPVI